jgi:hypothetical protein
VEPEYSKAKFKDKMENQMLPDLNYEDEPERLKELRKVGIEIDRRNLIN